MLGTYITFLVVLIIVTVYMLIVHSFLRSAENPEDEMREQALKRKPPEAHDTTGYAPGSSARGAPAQ